MTMGPRWLIFAVLLVISVVIVLVTGNDAFR